MTARDLILVAMAWAVIGVVVAFLMRRRGHDLFVWLVLGVALGPLVVPLAIERARYHSATEHRSAEAPTPQHRGFDIIAGVDGSEDSVNAIGSALALFGGRISSVTLATVVDFDARDSVTGHEVQEDARQMLDEVAGKIAYDPVDTIVLFGRADQALAEFARTSGMELVVIGARGHGASETLFGSVASRLVRGCVLPVYVGPAVAALATSEVAAGEPTTEKG
jgi:nucleotide-binding universal stress UspA family protein